MVGDNALKPAIIRAAARYLEYAERQSLPTGICISEWICQPRNQLSKPEQATKKAALKLFNSWVLNKTKIPFEAKESIPPRVSLALDFLDSTCQGSDENLLRSCCEPTTIDERVLDEDERVFKSTALELLRNWFNGEIEIEAVTPHKKIRFKREEEPRANKSRKPERKQQD
jgi:hypothetical protein